MHKHVLTSLLSLIALANASASESKRDVEILFERALPNSPNGYTPSTVQCPSPAPAARGASSVSSNETAWLDRRRNVTVSAMRTFLAGVQIGGFDAEGYFDQHMSNVSQLPNMAVSMSGGGWRALMNGAGALTAFDDRVPDSTGQGKVGGILQSATYLTGLSGGSWLVGSMFMNNFTTIPQIQSSDDVWQFQNSVLEGPPSGGIQLFQTVDYYQDLLSEVSGKEDADFSTTITDYWGQALSFQLINASQGGPAYTWSSIALDGDFQAGRQPMPIIVADERVPGELLVSGNTTVYEINPFEFGSFDPTVFGFIPISNLGTNFTNGDVVNNRECVVGFDNAGFLMGTSSSLFNTLLSQNLSSSVPRVLQDAIRTLAQAVGDSNEDIADWKPNPFYGYNSASNPNANETTLTLVDGGEDLQNIPLHPVIQPARNVDVIIAVDSSADTDTRWPNGTSLVATYERSLSQNISNGTAFPSIPDVNTFVNLGLNNRPTFFGCNGSNTSSPTPLIVYIPNAPYTYQSNVSTFQLDYNQTQRNKIILNGYNVATMGNGSAGDPTWPMCLGCAMLSRSFDRTNTTVPQDCARCFQTFCWNGTTDSHTPPLYEPSLKIANASGSSSSGGGDENHGVQIFGTRASTCLTLLSVIVALTLAL